VSGLDYRFGWSQVPAVAVIIANIVVIACFGSFILVLRENTFAASTVTVEAGQRVISTGLYAWVRHPMYSGGMVLMFAIPPAMGSSWALLISLLTMPLLGARTVDEERTLSAQLAGYGDYRRAVRYRLIPGVW
jgi:protein-S-isoprenylcysteine O-methyltransferase Ste14